MSLKIVENFEILSQFHTPESIVNREKELSQLKTNIASSVNTFVYGPCGSGKTLLIKKVVQNFSSVKGKAIYIDCSLYQTANAILREMLSDRPVFARSNYDLLKRLCERAKNLKLIICLDHAQKLKDTEIISKFISLAFTTLVVSDNEDFLHSIDPWTMSNIAGIIKLEGYTPEQAFEILNERADQALAKGSHTEEAIRSISEKCNGNIALAISMLKSSALKAEAENKGSIDEIDLDSIIIEHDCPEKLTIDEKILLEILKEWRTLPASRVLAFYQEKARNPGCERSFRKYMQSLCSKGLARAVGDKRGRIYEICGDDGKGNN
jgi:Cdc6-like AAA superfamily ATPase